MKITKDNNTLTNLPRHVAFIMDGNGRWAKSRGLPRLAGHRAGTENLRKIIKACVEFGIPYMTIYAFSTENWERPEDEVNGLMNILAEVIDNELTELHQEGVRLKHLGRLERLSPELCEKVKKASELTKNNTRLSLSIAWNYGGRDEIVYAIQNIIREGIPAEAITCDLINKYLFTAGTPDPDLIIRTSGEMRTSNFLIWQSAYSEWYTTSTYWPDFNKEEFRKALMEYGKRNRRFGKVSQEPCIPTEN